MRWISRADWNNQVAPPPAMTKNVPLLPANNNDSAKPTGGRPVTYKVRAQNCVAPKMPIPSIDPLNLYA